MASPVTYELLPTARTNAWSPPAVRRGWRRRLSFPFQIAASRTWHNWRRWVPFPLDMSSVLFVATFLMAGTIFILSNLANEFLGVATRAAGALIYGWLGMIGDELLGGWLGMMSRGKQ